MRERDNPMTLTQARAFLKRAREGIRDAEQALRDRDSAALEAALMEVSGSAGTIEGALDERYGDGIKGLTA